MVPIKCRNLLIAITLLACMAPAAREALGQPFCDLPDNQPPLCQQFLTTSCANPPTPSHRCYPIKLRHEPGLPNLLEAVDCSCGTFDGDCGPIFVEGDATNGIFIRCPGVCPIPPFGPDS